MQRHVGDAHKPRHGLHIPLRRLFLASTHLVSPQEYDYHLAAVNTITFVDEGRRFMTTSDDKTIRFWEMGINVQVRGFSRLVCLWAATLFHVRRLARVHACIDACMYACTV